MPVISNPSVMIDFPFVVFGIAHSHTQKLIFSHSAPHLSTHTLNNRRYCTARCRKCQAKLLILTTGILGEMGCFVQRQVTKEWSPLPVSQGKRSLV